MRIGSILVVIVVQIFFWLETVVNSPILPGDWAPLEVSFQVDVIYSTLALGMVAALPLYSPEKARNLVVQPGGIYGFAILYALFGFAWTLGMVAYLHFSGGVAASSVPDTTRLQELIQFVVMVSVGEELFFRVALDAYWGGLASTVIFGGFHLWAYSSAPGALLPGGEWILVQQIVSAMFFGAIFWAIYKFWGIGAAMVSHAAFDLVTSGAVGLNTVAFAHLGMFPM